MQRPECRDRLDAGALAAIAGQRGQKYRPKKGPAPPLSPYVFTFRGRRVKEVKTAFQAACVRAGLDRYEGSHYVGFTWHGFRHTWATWHVQNGTPLDVLQKLGGWTDPRMVQNYAHHTPGHLAGFAGNNRKTTT